MNTFFITGTQVYGPATEKSDLDIALKSSEAEHLESYLRQKGIEIQSVKFKFTDYFGYYFTLADFLKVNIIVLNTANEFKAWNNATDKMKKLDPIADREKRLKAFKIFIAKALGSSIK